MELAPLDLVLLGGAALLVGIGLFRGLSGELASFAGLVAAVAAGACLYGFAHAGVRAFGFNKGDATELVAAGVADFVLGLVAFGIVRWGVNKFVSFLVPQPTNALFGGLCGLVKSAAVLVLLTGVGFMQPGTYTQGYLATRSQIIHTLAEKADSYFAEHPEMANHPDEEPEEPETDE